MNETITKEQNMVNILSKCIIDEQDIRRFLKSKKYATLECTHIDESLSVIEIKDLIFGYTSSGSRKTIMNLQTPDLILAFERCIFTEELRFEDCKFSSIVFKNCQFLDHDWPGTKPSGVQSLGFSDVVCDTLKINGCVFSNPIKIYRNGPTRLVIHSTIISTVWLQSMMAQDSVLNVGSLAGDKLHLPSEEKKFKEIYSDDTSLSCFNGVHKITVALTKK